MFIILEGIDKTGKTSLANHLSDLLNLPIIKFSAPKGDPYIEYMEFLLKQKQPAILDRFYLGEQVYGPVYRNKNGLGSWKTLNIERLLMMRGALPIYTFTHEDDIANNFKKKDEQFAKEADIHKLRWLYDQEKDVSELTWKTFDYRKDSNYQGIDRVALRWYHEMLHTLKHKQDLIETRTMGDYNAETLILGEVSNVELEKEEYKHVNVGFANGPSAEMLFNGLRSIGIGARTIATSNIYKVHAENKFMLEPELTLPHLKNIILLGNKAEEGFKTRNPQIPKRISIKRIIHPSFALRTNMTWQDYGEVLRKVI